MIGRGPRADLTVARYRRHADGYDATCKRTQPFRYEAVDRLRLKEGDVVLDAACGTGMSLPLLADAVGATGRVIGIELSPDMLRLARDKVTRHGWTNVTLLEGALEDAPIPANLDAVLCFYTHDVMRSRAALDNIFASAKPEAPVAVAGMKAFPWWTGVANLFTLVKAYPYMTTFEGLFRPWSLLEHYVPRLSVRTTQLGMGYIAHGAYRPR